jgi:hypothetical protein
MGFWPRGMRTDELSPHQSAPSLRNQSTGMGVLEQLKDAIGALMPKGRNRKGRSTTEPFLSLPRHMIRSSAYRSLSLAARAVLIELVDVYRGTNNGYLALSTRDAAARIGTSKDTAARALAELQAKGFIVRCSRGHFDRKTPHASEYRLTFRPCDRTSGRPTNDFMRWQSDQPNSVAGPTTGTASPTSGAGIALTKENSPSRSDQRDRVAGIEASDGPTTGTHIIYHLGAEHQEASAHQSGRRAASKHERADGERCDETDEQSANASRAHEGDPTGRGGAGRT